jgi:hypothetical protein
MTNTFAKFHLRSLWILLFLTFLACGEIETEVRFNLTVTDDESVQNLLVPVGDTLQLADLSSVLNATAPKKPSQSINNSFPYELYYESELTIRPASLSASYISFFNDYLYVSAHEQGTDFDGELLGIYFKDEDVDDPKTSFTIRTNGEQYEWNSVFVDNTNPAQTTLVFAGDNPAAGAVMHEVLLEYRGNRWQNDGSNQRVANFSGSSGNSVTRVGDFYYLSAGGSRVGGVYSYQISTGQPGPFFSNTYMKYLDTNGSDRLIALKGGPDAELFVFDISSGFTGTPQRSIPLDPVTPEQGKNTVWLDGNTAYLALGQRGLAIVPDINSSNQADVIYPTGTRQEACNAVTVDDEFIYLAYDQYVEILDKATNTSYGALQFPRGVLGREVSMNHVIAFTYDGEKHLAIADKNNVRIISMEEDDDDD